MSHLSRRISPITLFMLSLNGIIGSGWLFAPFYAAKIAGSAALISWFLGGICATLVAFTFAELSTMLPVAGGTAHIPQLSHGPFVSFIMGWIAWITSVILAPIEVQAVLQYASLFFPSLMHAETLTLWGYCWAGILMTVLCLLNIFSYRGLMHSNFVLFVFKFSVILLTIFTLLMTRFQTANFSGLITTTMSQAGWHTIFSAVATGGVVLAFNGFKSGVEMAGETKNLKLAIPLSTAGSVIACLLIYLGLQVCFIGALDNNLLKNGWHNLSYAGDVGPFVGLAAALGLFWLLKLIYLNAVVSPLGAGLIYVTSTARILYAMSRIGYVPKFLSYLNHQRFPVWAIIVNFLIGMLSFLPLPGWQVMVNFLVSAIVITYAMGPIALISLRYTLPDKKRPFKLPAAHFICLFAFYICNLFSYWTGWETLSKLAIMLLLGLVLFFIAFLTKRVKMTIQEFKTAWWMIPYMGGLILISYLGSYGGLGLIPFGWDFLVIGILSILVFFTAVKCRAPLATKEVNKLIEEETLAFGH